ncbi:MAG: four helix bundle protein [Gemmatimonadaceae bacterium]
MHRSFDEWEAGADEGFRRDRMWRMRAYRLSLYLAEVGSMDAREMTAEQLTRDIASQLFRALGSIRANLGEGYSRSAGRDRARFFEYALGSARESREWYAHAGLVLGADRVRERIELLEEIVRLLLAIIPRERGRTIRPAAMP